MAGLSNKSNSFRTFVTMFEGKFTKKVEPGTPDAVMRMNKKDKEVWELHYNSLEDVYIRNIEKKDHAEYGLSWVITLETDDGQSFDLQLPYSGRTTSGFMFRLPNVDINKPVTLVPSRFKEIGNGGVEKFKTYLTVHQHGEKLPQYWTKDDRKDLPEMEQVMRKGKYEWDDTKQMQYIEKYITETFTEYFSQFSDNHPKLQPSQTTAGPVQSTKTPVTAIPKDHPLAMEYKFACDAGFKGSIQDYEKLRPAYMEVKDRFGFAGTIVDYQKSLGAAAAAAPATAKPTPPPPGPKLGNAPVATSGGEKPMPKGTTVHDPMQSGFNDVKKYGYAGSIEDFAAFCKVNGYQPNEVIFISGELHKSDLPF